MEAMKLCAPTVSFALVVLVATACCGGARPANKTDEDPRRAEVRATMQRLRADPAQPDPCQPPSTPNPRSELPVGSVELGEIGAFSSLGQWYFDGTRCYQPTVEHRAPCWERCYPWQGRERCDLVQQLCAEHAR
jgi:hypothetical protein